MNININTNDEYISVEELITIEDGNIYSFPSITISYENYLDFFSKLKELYNIKDYNYNFFDDIVIKLKNDNFQLYINGTTNLVFINSWCKSDDICQEIWNMLINSIDVEELPNIH